MYSGGPEFWNRRNHTDRTFKKSTVADALKRTIPVASLPKFLETPAQIKSVIRKRVLNKDDHGDRLSQYSFKENVGINNLIRAFHRTHRGPDTHVDVIEFKLGLREFAISAHDEAVEELFREFSRNGISVNYVEFAHKVCGDQEQNTQNTLQSLIDKIKDAHSFHPTLLSSLCEDHLCKGLINIYDFIEVLGKFICQKVNTWDVESLCEEVEKVNGMIVFQDFFDKYLGSPNLSKQSFGPSSRKALTIRLSPLVESRASTPDDVDHQQSPDLFKVPEISPIDCSSPSLSSKSSSKSGRLRPVSSGSRRTISSSSQFRPGSAQYTPKYKSRKSKRPVTASSSSADTIISLHRSLLRTFLGLDFTRSGWVSVQDFRTVLQQHGGGGLTSENYSELIMTKPGVEEDGNINYMNFLHHLTYLLEKGTAARRSPEIFV